MDPNSQIKGYRQLTQAEVDLINVVKEHGNELSDRIADLAKNPNVDQRWLAIAKTDLQKGFMALCRAIAQPEGF